MIITHEFDYKKFDFAILNNFNKIYIRVEYIKSITMASPLSKTKLE